MSSRYWNDDGDHQKEYDRLWKLIPASGASDDRRLEALRAISRITYDLHNNGWCNFETMDGYYGQMWQHVLSCRSDLLLVPDGCSNMSFATVQKHIDAHLEYEANYSGDGWTDDEDDRPTPAYDVQSFCDALDAIINAIVLWCAETHPDPDAPDPVPSERGYRICVLVDVIAPTPEEAYIKLRERLDPCFDDSDDPHFEGYETADNDWFGLDTGDEIGEQQVMEIRLRALEKMEEEAGEPA